MSRQLRYSHERPLYFPNWGIGIHSVGIHFAHSPSFFSEPGQRERTLAHPALPTRTGVGVHPQGGPFGADPSPHDPCRMILIGPSFLDILGFILPPFASFASHRGGLALLNRPGGDKVRRSPRCPRAFGGLPFASACPPP